jgi:hypothetical protein
MAVIAHFGEARWNAFLAAYAVIDPYFAQPILATTQMPAEKQLAFTDRVVDAFYGGHDRAYWMFGEISCLWVLTSGPYQHFLKERDAERFAQDAQLIWDSYHDEGRCQATFVDRETIEIRLRDCPVHHIYFELCMVGFLKRGFELVMNCSLEVARIRGYSLGDDEVLYRLRRT